MQGERTIAANSTLEGFTMICAMPWTRLVGLLAAVGLFCWISASARSAEPAVGSGQIVAGPEDEDLPAAAVDRQGNVWLAYSAYKNSRPLPVLPW